jgi:hypothetical protein
MKAGVDMPKTEYPEGGEVAGLDDYVALIKTIQADWQTERKDHLTHALWFRGQDDDWPLLPKVLRTDRDPDTGENRCFNEFQILNTFTALYRNYIVDRFEEKSIELLAFMQHNGLPTRFLDWTQSALIGLYFAVAKATWNASGTPIVWIMNPGKMNEFTIDWLPIGGPFLAANDLVQARLKMIGFVSNGGTVSQKFWEEYPDFGSLREERLLHPVAFYPTASSNLRLATQKGCFTVQGSKGLPIESIFKDSNCERFLKKVIIKTGAAVQIREELRIMGITPRSVFPDLGGLSQELSGREYMIGFQR